jgi:CRP/FNR family transcriptional regulator, cyclic AMP receptor protein
MPNVDPVTMRQIPLFALLDDQELAVLANDLDEKRYLAGQIIISAGEKGDAMYIVQSGRVELYLQDTADERVGLGFVEPGDIFGELGLLDNEPRSASAVALENSTILIVDRHDLQMLITAHPLAALDMMAMLGRRIRDADILVRDRVTRNVNEEIAVAANLGQRLSDLLTYVAGDIRFVYVSFIWFFVWIVLNIRIIPTLEPFDPFPFGLLTMVVSLEAIFLSLFVLISQNRQAEREKLRNDIEYEVNLRAEIEVRGLMKQVQHLEQLVLEQLSLNETAFSQGAKDNTLRQAPVNDQSTP